MIGNSRLPNIAFINEINSLKIHTSGFLNKCESSLFFLRGQNYNQTGHIHNIYIYCMGYVIVVTVVASGITKVGSQFIFLDIRNISNRLVLLLKQFLTHGGFHKLTCLFTQSLFFFGKKKLSNTIIITNDNIIINVIIIT